MKSTRRSGRAQGALFFLGFVAGGIAHASDVDANVIREAQALLTQSADAAGPGMVMLVARGDNVLFRGALGKADVELDVPLSPKNVFRIGSNTKQFTAATIFKLIGQGRVALDDPLSRFLPDYPNGGHITIDELLRHTSGVKDYTTIDGYFDAAIRQDLDTEKLIAVFKDLPVDFAPGTSSNYSNSGYVLLGAVIEHVTGKSWHAAMRELLLAPLGLADTTYGEDAPLISGRAAGYSVDANARTVNAPYFSMTQAAAAGGLVSTAVDLFRWMRALHAGKVLDADNYRRMTTVAPTPSGNSTGVAAGIDTLRVRGEPAFEQVGRDPGFMSETLYVPKPAISVVVLANTDSPRADVSVVAAKLAAIAMGRPYPVRRPVTLTSAQMQSISGVYQRGERGHRTITVKAGLLYTQRDGGHAHVLHAASANELYFDEVLDYFTVTRNASGAVVAIDEFSNGEAPPLRLQRRGDVGPQTSP